MARRHLDRSETRPLEQTREIKALRKDLEAFPADDSITFAKIQDIATDRLIGRDTAASGDPEEISVGGGLEFSGLGGIQQADNGTTNARLADMAQNTIKGRVTASTGDPEDLSASQARTVLGLATGDSPEFSGVNIGHASDTTITRAGVGDIAVEGKGIYRADGTDVPVADGGTGRSSHTAYAVICGGTTGTGAQQSIASVGTSAQVLTSNGASALPTFQDLPVSGQPIPSSSTLAVNTMALLVNVSGGILTPGSSTAGSNLSMPRISNDSTPLSAIGAAQAGTWLNISGANVTNGEAANFVRTA